MNENACTRKIITLQNTMVLPLQQSGRWIFVVPTVEPLVIACKNTKIEHIQLEKSGILALVGKCVVTATHFKIETIQEFTQQVYETYLPSYNLTFLEADKKALPKIVSETDKVKLKNIISNANELNNLGTRMRKLQTNFNLRHDNNDNSHTIGTYSLSTIAIIAIIGYIIYRFLKKQRATPVVVQTPPTQVIEVQPTTPKPTKRKISFGKLKVAFDRNNPSTSTL